MCIATSKITSIETSLEEPLYCFQHNDKSSTVSIKGHIIYLTLWFHAVGAQRHIPARGNLGSNFGGYTFMLRIFNHG
jgi:hypothetical protein